MSSHHATNNGTLSTVNIVQSLTTRSHSFIPTADVGSGGEQSSPNNQSSSSINTHNQTSSSNVQAFSVFANVNIPERNGAKWTSSSTYNSSGHQTINSVLSMTPAPVPPARTDILQTEANGADEAPMLPKKPNSASSSQAAFSPTFGDTISATTSKLDSSWSLSDEFGLPQQTALFSSTSSIYNNQTGAGSDNEPLPSPLPRVVVSPRHEIHSTSNRSPFQCAANLGKSNCSSSSNFRYVIKVVVVPLNSQNSKLNPETLFPIWIFCSLIFK